MIVYLFVYVLALHITGRRGDLYSSNEGSPKDNFQYKYPNLYFTAEDLPKLRAQAASSHAAIYEELVKNARGIRSLKKFIPPESESQFNARWNEIYGNVLAPLAVYCVLNPSDQESLGLATLFMKRLTSYKTWLVKGREHDEIPMAHSLIGYVTCFDCLHNSFTQDQRVRFAAKILETGTRLFTASYEKWWGRSYIHNHVTTNYIALLMAAIVLQPYYPEESIAWRKDSSESLHATMKFLQLVVDGSFQEGVSYGTYTMRSLTQFLLISERHLGRTYRTNNWLSEHFNFLLYTIIPGFKLTVGFADTNLNWAYGPESQLSFLESYIHKDGTAEWLRNEIKQRKINRYQSIDLKGILYTDFLFYNKSLKAKRSTEVKLHVFSDWGVITYGGGVPEPHVFLAFKCGHLHGRAINLLRPSLKLKIQRGFTPGHEHPDQGSFVFVTKDQPVVTESRYGPKYTFLQNTLMFGPSDQGCSLSYLGQLGECKTWFDFDDNRAWVGRADLVGYSRENNVIFISGEMTQVYDVGLGLTTVYRALITLAPTVLVVVDIVKFRAHSMTTHTRAFFHNSDYVFKVDDLDNVKNRCAAIGHYRMCWNHLNAETVKVETKNSFKVAKMRYPTNYISVTSKRLKLLTSTAFVFHGTEHTLEDLKLSKIKENGIRISLKLNSLAYHIILSTRHDDPRLRRRLLGTSGYGKVYVSSINSESTIHLGVKTSRDAKFFNVTPQITMKQEQRGYVGFVHILICVMLLILLLNFKIRRTFRKWLPIAFISLLIWLAILYACISSSNMFSTSGSTILAPDSISPIFPSRKNEPYAVLISGLPSSGMELARELFTTNPDFITIGVPSEWDVTDEEDLDLCEWTKRKTLDEKFKIWWNTLLTSPIELRENDSEDYVFLVDPLDISSTARTFIHKSKGAFAAVSLKNPSWLFRRSVLFEKNQTPLLYVLRDPRSWIEHISSRLKNRDLLLKEFKIAIEKQACSFPLEIKHLREMKFGTLKPHVALAYIWTAFTTYALRLRSTIPPGRLKIVRFEDIIKLPRATADDVYSFLEMPFPAAVEHRIMQVTLTRLYKFKNYGTIEPKLCTWGKILTKIQVSEIERICKEAMKNIGYS